jgi:hypothetical protein
MTDQVLPARQFAVHDYDGRVGDLTHITRTEQGMVPTAAIASLKGARGEIPGEHRNHPAERWETFKEQIATHGIQNPVFITVDHNAEPKISEGNSRRDAAVELGMSHTPVVIRYFGHAERQGTVTERWQRQPEMEVGPRGRRAHPAKLTMNRRRQGQLLDPTGHVRPDLPPAEARKLAPAAPAGRRRDRTALTAARDLHRAIRPRAPAPEQEREMEP